ncbi:transcriptional regulator [Longispora fulva]|uniref:Transcriptional regulator with XRE-family HTH domain n=1 Tax=Longispora fulva TaxID=619741 RepID=A0A8J7GLE1_9ACTN|nr:helix-turn-helix transcriptional regulator [Longispora fulva]MBG6139840.1 transcriptional regulator with XRE-family HTH domain [Longispora fulva]GIG57775.1 transcriptional regulator [Longispora fulva]
MDVRRVRFGEALRRLREERDLTLEQVGGEIGWSYVRLHRLETAETRPSVDRVRPLLDLYGIREPEYGNLLDQAQDLSVEGWWREHRGSKPGQRTYAELESGVTAINAYSGAIVPGLLQTEEYARYRIRSELGDSDQIATDANLAVRMGRQKVIGSIDFEVILDEVVLLRPSCPPAVMAEQLRHLASALPRVTVRVLLLNRVIDDFLLPQNTFALYRLPGGDEIGLIDTMAIGPQPIDADKLPSYRHAYDRLRDAALNIEDSREFILQAAEAKR